MSHKLFTASIAAALIYMPTAWSAEGFLLHTGESEAKGAVLLAGAGSPQDGPPQRDCLLAYRGPRPGASDELAKFVRAASGKEFVCTVAKADGELRLKAAIGDAVSLFVVLTSAGDCLWRVDTSAGSSPNGKCEPYRKRG